MPAGSVLLMTNHIDAIDHIQSVATHHLHRMIVSRECDFGIRFCFVFSISLDDR